jgi:hypothetical protein
MVDLQREFARKAIEALKLRDDPVPGVVELSNEQYGSFAIEVAVVTTRFPTAQSG